jgi:hypothetical protein
MVRRSALVHGYRRSSTCPHVQGEAEVMGPVVVIPGIARDFLRVAEAYRRTGDRERGMHYEQLAGRLIREATSVKWVRTIDGWLKRTGRR